MSSVSLDNDGEPPRKRVRKGTKSCWECKRRKIKCQLSSEDVPVCSGCLARGTTCLSQEYPEEREISGGNNQVGERLRRMERLLETLLAKVTAYEEEEETQKTMLTPESLGNDVLPPFSASASSNPATDSPFLSLFDNSLIGRRDIGVSQMPTPASQAGSKTQSCRIPKIDRIRQALVELLPSQKDTDLINDNSSSWMLIHTLINKPSSFAIESTFNIAEVRNRHPTTIARTLLHLAVCLQQLDPGFDLTQLHLYPSPEARMERYITTVQALITSDDELVSTMEGLECLTLLGLYQINAGNPRRAWLSFRRALNICQLMGLHKKGVNLPPGGREMWSQIIQGDRYLALLLGLPCGSEDVGFSPDETFKNPNSDKDNLFVRHLCDISGRLIERNQTDYSHAYAATQDIDEQLEKLGKEMPLSWWKIPDILVDDRSSKAAEQFDRIMTQIWFYQLEALLHLPFMLKAATERRYDYSKFSCLKASREMARRYLALRDVGNRAFCCKIVDFGALTATVTLFLGLVGSSTIGESQEQKTQRKADHKLIQSVLESMEELSRGGKDIVATQSVNVIKSLLAVDSPSSESNGSLKLTIPYFGTISIVRSQQTPKLNPATSLPYPLQNQPYQIGQQMPSQNWQGISAYPSAPSMAPAGMNFPMVQFTSSQYPQGKDQPPIENWGLTEADTLLFDSLLNTDIEGNWVF